MRIVDFIEEINLDKKKLTEDLRYQIASEYSDDEWIKATNIFLNGIENKHTVEGKVIWNLTDICYVYKRENISLTNKQRIYISSNLIDNWDQLSLMTRLKLYPY